MTQVKHKTYQANKICEIEQMQYCKTINLKS